MKEFVTDENQFKHIEEFSKSIIEDKVDSNLTDASLVLTVNLLQLYMIKIEDKEIGDYEIFKTHKPIFESINKQYILPERLLKSFGWTDDQVEKIKTAQKADDKETIKEILKKTFEIDVEKDRTSKPILKKITEKVNRDVMKHMVETIYTSNKVTNQIINGINDYLKLSLELKKIDNQLISENVSLNLYRDAYETYLKLLKDFYYKIENPPQQSRRNNYGLYKFYKNNYPLLIDSKYRLLRNDISHLNYDIRGNYTPGQIKEERTTIMVKALTAIIVRAEVIYDMFSESVESIEDSDSKSHEKTIK